MKLTFFNRLRLCFEILTAKSGHKHKAQEKMLSTFQRGYVAGVNDERLSNKAAEQASSLVGAQDACADR